MNQIFKRLRSYHPALTLEALHRFEESHVFPGCLFQGDPSIPFESLSLEHDGLVMSGWCLNPTATEGLLVFGGNNVPLAPLAEEFSKRFPNHKIYLMPYPGYEGQPGRPSEDSLTRLARSLYHLASQSCSSIDVLGMSLGTGVATFVATHESVRRLVLVTPYDTMLSPAKNLFPYLPVSLLMRHQFPSLQWLSKMSHCPDIFILGAINDATIPRWSTENLFAGFRKKVEDFSKLLNTPIELPEIAWFDVAHRDVIGAGADQIASFLNQSLFTKAPDLISEITQVLDFPVETKDDRKAKAVFPRRSMI